MWEQRLKIDPSKSYNGRRVCSVVSYTFRTGVASIVIQFAEHTSLFQHLKGFRKTRREQGSKLTGCRSNRGRQNVSILYENVYILQRQLIN